MVWCEHFKYAHPKLSLLLCIGFNCMLIHGHKSLMDTVLVLILKDKKGNVTSADNYRLIAITNVSSKILALVFLSCF